MQPAKVAEQKTCKPPWSRWTWLPHIVYTMNTQVRETTKQMPYELVFGQPPRSVKIPEPPRFKVVKEEKECNGDEPISMVSTEDLQQEAYNEEDKNELLKYEISMQLQGMAECWRILQLILRRSLLKMQRIAVTQLA
ncbi:hypothetical protein EMCRGX_G033244 [Ephydatia muelleri]